MPVMVPVVTPVVELKDAAFSFQGRWPGVTVNVKPEPVQLLKVTAVIEPMAVPDSPLPCLRVAFVLEDVHTTDWWVVVSVRVVVPALAVVAPPGLTVQVAVTARAAPVPTPITKAAAP